MSSFGLHWFRRDLRIEDNPALYQNWKINQGRVLGIFFFDGAFLSRDDFSHTRFAFFLDSLLALKNELQKHGGDLLVLDQSPKEGFVTLLNRLKIGPMGLPKTVSFNRDYEPFARNRDSHVSKAVENYGVSVLTERDHLLIEPPELSKPTGGFYQVFTPFAKRWFDLFNTNEIQNRLKPLPKMAFYAQWSQSFPQGKTPEDKLLQFIKRNSEKVTIVVPPAGTISAQKSLSEFSDKISAYADQRDFPSSCGTSRLSHFLKNGSLTSAQIIRSLKLNKIVDLKAGAGPSVYLKQIIWREFYYHILFHCPFVETSAFNPKYNNIAWDNNVEHFKAWQTGTTGYPIVDAGMRELLTTGWMHNRVRMIVASFLTKDLLIDWRWGEQHFMKHLIDGDLACNNGGWQWAASTGCDPQPYFRVFNSILQGQRFDSNGEYIRKFVPELANLSIKELHKPQNPIVDHKTQSIRAIAMYKAY